MAARKIATLAASLVDPRTYSHLLKVVHFYGYAHVRERRAITMGPDVGMGPHVSLRNGERITIGARTNVGERSYLWAGDSTGRITIGSDCRLAPEVYISASNYGMEPGVPMVQQPKVDQDVVIGNDVWLGVRVTVVAGVTIGDGCVVGAGAVVTRDLPPGSVAVGVPARIVKNRFVAAPVAS
jgi:acetyltransferase-like isoleucine patch superfamily enzyme